MRMRNWRLHNERGQAAPLAAAVAALAVVLTIAVGRLAGDLVDAARARTAADAVALASVIGGRAAGEGLAARHHATVIGWSRHGADVLVTVQVGNAVVSARATGGPLAGDGD
jgi:hypothetical protein